MQGIGFIWIAAIIVFLVLEAVTYQMVSIWFALGAIGGMIAYLFGADFFVQMIVFIIVSAIMFMVFRPLAMKLMKTKGLKTNTDSLIGKNILITQEVSNIEATGQGKINGMVWTVRGETDDTIHTGEVARIKDIEGVKLIVEKISV